MLCLRPSGRRTSRRQPIANQLFDRSVREFIRLKEICLLQKDCGGVWMSYRSLKETVHVALFLLVTATRLTVDQPKTAVLLAF